MDNTWFLSHIQHTCLCMLLKGRKERKNTEWPIINFNCCPLISRRRHVNRLCKLIKRVIQSTYCLSSQQKKRGKRSLNKNHIYHSRKMCPLLIVFASFGYTAFVRTLFLVVHLPFFSNASLI